MHIAEFHDLRAKVKPLPGLGAPTSPEKSSTAVIHGQQPVLTSKVHTDKMLPRSTAKLPRNTSGEISMHLARLSSTGTARRLPHHQGSAFHPLELSPLTPPHGEVTAHFGLNTLWSLLETHWQLKLCFENKPHNLQDFQKAYFLLQPSGTCRRGHGRGHRESLRFPVFRDRT